MELPLHAVSAPKSNIDRGGGSKVKYALCKEEYVGVLGKEYAAKDQERRLAVDLTKLNSDVLLQLPTQLSFEAKLF